MTDRSSPVVCLAVDLGAGSGRVLAGLFQDSRLELEEIRRFPNDPAKLESGWHWQFEKLLAEIIAGIRGAVAKYGDAVVSVGVDTWGVDYGLLDAGGNLLGLPFQYRDSRTNGMEALAVERMPREEIYRRTGIQFLFFNTLFQLLAEARGPQRLLDRADRLLFMPDLINYHLSGRKVVERSIASTSQLLNPATRDWDREVIAAMELPEQIFGELVDAGADLGPLLPEIQDAVGGRPLRVIAPACHDTASAVAGVPAEETSPVFLSSGTWSLIGCELEAPIVTAAAQEAGFSNEGGAFGSTRFLKNIAGMWLLQECKREWDAAGNVLSYSELVDAAAAAAPFAALLDPDAPEFTAPESMSNAIRAWLERTNQSMPQTPGGVTRCILESLALKYRAAIAQLSEVTGQSVERIHIVGGGSQNDLLNQFAAGATGCAIVAGPVEATSAGNILLQLHALGRIQSLAEGRSIIRKSFSTRTFTPGRAAGWDDAFARFNSLASMPCHPDTKET